MKNAPTSALLALLTLTACGGGGSASSAGPGPNPTPNDPPTLTIRSLASDVTVPQGGTVEIQFLDRDPNINANGFDESAPEMLQTAFHLDVDGLAATAGDTFVVSSPMGHTGTVQTALLDMSGVPAGTYHVIGVATDQRGATARTRANGKITVTSGAYADGILGIDVPNLTIRAHAPGADGGAFVVGTFTGQIDLGIDPSGNPIQLAAAGGTDALVVHIDADGTPIWARQVGSGGADYATHATTLSTGEVAVLGGYTQDVSVPANQRHMTANGPTSIFIGLFEPNGDFRWLRRASSAGIDEPKGLAAHSLTNGTEDAIVVAGEYEGHRLELNNTFADPVGGKDTFVATMFANGQSLWMKRIAGAGDDKVESLTVLDDTFATIGVGGSFALQGNFGEGQDQPVARGENDGFAAFYEPNGTYMGMRQFTGDGGDTVLGITAVARPRETNYPFGWAYTVSGTSSSTNVTVDDLTVQLPGSFDDSWMVRFKSRPDNFGGELVTGEPQWGRVLVASDIDDRHVQPIALADGGVVVAGRYGRGAQFGSQLPNLPADGAFDLHVTCINVDGTNRWTRRIGSNVAEEQLAFTGMPDGSYLLSARHRGADLTLYADGRSLNNPNAAYFLTRLNPDGTLGGDGSSSASSLLDTNLLFSGLLRFDVVGTKAYMNGVIDGRTPELVQRLLETHPSLEEIELVLVPGSDDDNANIRASRLVRAAGLNTRIPAHGQVSSGGVDFFCAGISRAIGPEAFVGVHSWGTGGGQSGANVPRGDARHNLYLDYYREMNIPADFYWFTLQWAPDEIHGMSAAEIRAYRLTN